MSALPPSPEVHAVLHLGPAPPVENERFVLVGQDGGQSIALENGEWLFVFADTLLAHPDAWRAGWPAARWPIRREQGRFLANCCARARGATLVEALRDVRYVCGDDGFPREILQATPAEGLARVRFWPEHGLNVCGRVFLYYLGIEHFAPACTWGFRNGGTGLALLDPATGQAERLRWDGDWRLWPDAGDGSHGGVSVLRHAARAYVFGSLRQGESTGARLARAEVSALDDPRAYEFLASSAPTWTRDPARAFDLGACGNEFSVSWNAHLGRYLMTYVERGGRELCLRAADEIWGPYSAPTRVGALPLEESNQIAALAFEHAGFARLGGRRLALSYCQANFTRNGLVELSLA